MKRMLLALALIAVAPPARAGEADAAAREVLAQDRYRFCHEKDYPLTRDEQAWCPIVGAESSACPAFPEACKLPPVEGTEIAGRGRIGTQGNARRTEGDRRRGAGPTEARKQEEDTRTRPDPEPERDRTITVPNMSGLAMVVLFAMVAIFVVVIARALAKHFVRGGEDEAPPDEPKPDAEASAEAGPRGPVETDVERLLSRARAAAGRGDYARAIDDAYAALLRRLDGDGLIEIHPSRTNGDYVRRLADRPDLRRAVRDVARDVERVQFGDAAPSEPLFRAVMERVLPLVGRALSVVLLCFGLSAVISCGDTGGPTAFYGDSTPSGMRAVIETLGKQGITARYRTEALSALTEPGTVVLLPGVRVDAPAWEHLVTWAREKGGRLVLAGVTPPASLGMRIAPDDETSAELRPVWDPRVRVLIPPGRRLVSTHDEDDPPSGSLLRRGDSTYAVHQRTTGKGWIAVFADDRLFTNVALTVPGNATFLARFFTGLGDVELCDGLTGAGAATPIESIQRAQLTPVILQLFVLLGLLYLWRGRPFSRLRDPPAETRRAFADHARALGVAYARAKASRHVLGLYTVWALERLRERVHLAGRHGLVPLAEAIAARTGRPEAEVMRVLVDAAGARDEAAPPSSFRPRSVPPPPRGARGESDADLALMRELEGFLSAMGHRKPARRSRDQNA